MCIIYNCFYISLPNKHKTIFFMPQNTEAVNKKRKRILKDTLSFFILI